MKSYVQNSAVNRAIRVRNELGLGLLDAVDILKLLKDRENISIIMTPMKGDISGFFMRKNDIGLIVINSARSLGHQLFTAAHEYYHIKFDKGMNGRVCPIKRYEEEFENELQANIFASYFLMPDDSLRFYINERTENGSKALNIRDIVYLENYFMVSHTLMLQRLKAMGELSEQEVEIMKQGIIKKAVSLGYSSELYKNTADKCIIIHSNYAELAEELLENDKISYGKYEEVLIDAGYEDILFGDTIREDGAEYEC